MTSTSNACDGLSPGTPGAPTARYELANDISYASTRCDVGTSDGHGNLAFPYGESRRDHLDFVSSSGSWRATYDYYSVDLTPQLDGFMGIHQWHTEGYELLRYSTDGAADIERRITQTGSAVIRRDPRGGVVVFEDPDGTLRAFDAQGTQRWAVKLAFGWVSALEVDRQGNVLALQADGQTKVVTAQWVDPGGNPRPAFHPAGLGFAFYALFPKVGSGLFLRAQSGNSTSWVGAFAALSTQMDPAPAWLTARPNTELAMARGGKAYAVFAAPEPGVQTACEDRIEIFAPDGESCGTAVFSFGGVCVPRGVAVGYDGTVIQRLPLREETCQTETVCKCGWRWFRGFLK